MPLGYISPARQVGYKTAALLLLLLFLLRCQQDQMTLSSLKPEAQVSGDRKQPSSAEKQMNFTSMGGRKRVSAIFLRPVSLLQDWDKANAWLIWPCSTVIAWELPGEQPKLGCSRMRSRITSKERRLRPLLGGFSPSLRYKDSFNGRTFQDAQDVNTLKPRIMKKIIIFIIISER